MQHQVELSPTGLPGCAVIVAQVLLSIRRCAWVLLPACTVLPVLVHPRCVPLKGSQVKTCSLPVPSGASSWPIPMIAPSTAHRWQRGSPWGSSAAESPALSLIREEADIDLLAGSEGAHAHACMPFSTLFCVP